MKKKQRIIALILAVTVLIVALSFAVYSAHNANHVCTGENCSICAQIEMCKNLTKTLYVVIVAILIAAVMFRTGRLILKSTKQIFYATPVIKKERLLN